MKQRNLLKYFLGMGLLIGLFSEYVLAETSPQPRTPNGQEREVRTPIMTQLHELGEAKEKREGVLMGK